MVHTHNVSGNKGIYSLLIAGAVISAAMLSGCNDSATAEANRKAVDSSGKAAARTADAGQYQPSQALLTQANSELEKNVSNQAQQIKNIVDNKGDAQAIKPIADKLALLVEKKDTAADLKDAATTLNAALSAGESAQPEDLYKSLVQAQLGQVYFQQSQAAITSLQDALAKLSRQASSVMILADRVAVLGGSAVTIEGKIPVPASVDAGIARYTKDSQAAADLVSQKSQIVADLEKQIADRQAKASELSAQASTAIQKADRGTGQESVEDMKNAIAIRAQADKISEEIANLQPKLQTAKTERNVALLTQKNAQDNVAILLAAKANIAKKSEARAGESSTLRSQALDLINGADGLAARSAEFKKSVSELKNRLEAARTVSSSAKSKFSESLNSLRNYRKWVDQEVKDKLDAKDPLIAARNQKLPESLLLTFGANASYRGAQAEIIGLLTVMLQNQVGDAVTRAYKLAGETTEVPVQSGGDVELNRSRENARKELESAENLAKQALGADTDTNSQGKYLALLTQSAIYRGMYAVTGDNGMKDLSDKAAQEAQSRNPAALSAADAK